MHYAILGAISALLIGVYAWSAKSGWLELWGSSAESSYYNELGQGFRAGQLNLKREVPAALAQLANPYDPVANSRYVSDFSAASPLLDLSYYQGKLYLYFGITPALVLFLPYYEVTGHYLLHKDGVVVFCAAGFLAGLWLLYGMWRRYFAEVSIGAVAAAVLALGLATGTLQLLARSDVHEVAISCGCALTMMTLALLWRALHSGRVQGWWLAGASLTYGLAVGARPSLLFGALILLAPVACLWRAETGQGRWLRRWALLAAACGPIAVIGLGLMFYNRQRFGDPFEFGWRYQWSWEFPKTGEGFDLRYLGYNLLVYFLEPVQWGGGFPFVGEIRPPVLPAGHARFEHPFGVLTNIPLVWLALAVPLGWRGGWGGLRSGLRWFGILLLLLFGVSALTLGLFFAASLRYEVEFLTVLVLLGVMGVLCLELALAGRSAWRLTARWGWGLLLAFSLAFNLLAIFNRYFDTYSMRETFFASRGQMAEAMIQCQKMLEMRPDNSQAFGALGGMLLQQGKVSEATSYLKRALQINPDLADAHNNLGVVLVREGRVSEAVDCFERALQINPNYAEAHYNMGKALIEQNKVSAAIAHYERALQINPDYVDAHCNMGKVLIEQNKVSAAVAHFELALRIKPDNADANNDLGVALVRERRVAEAVDCFERALQVNPNHAKARLNLCYALSHLGEQLAAQGKWDEAIQRYQRVIELKPDDAQAQDKINLLRANPGTGGAKQF